MLFFFSEDKHFVLKTVKESEKDFFFHGGVLENYFRHMMDEKDSLLCRFLGLYKIKMGADYKKSKLPLSYHSTNTTDNKKSNLPLSP